MGIGWQSSKRKQLKRNLKELEKKDYFANKQFVGKQLMSVVAKLLFIFTLSPCNKTNNNEKI